MYGSVMKNTCFTAIKPCIWVPIFHEIKRSKSWDLWGMCNQKIHEGVTYSILRKGNLPLRQKWESYREGTTLVVICIWVGMHTSWHSYACMKWPSTWPHEENSNERLVILLLILTGFLFESLFFVVNTRGMFELTRYLSYVSTT